MDLIFETLPAQIEATDENIAKAKAFVLEKWAERAKEMGRPAPEDLTNACKFASMFCHRVFGGRMRGNWWHQYNELSDGRKLDLTDGAGGTQDKVFHDRRFWQSRDHKESLESNLPRVMSWVQEFLTDILLTHLWRENT